MTSRYQILCESQRIEDELKNVVNIECSICGKEVMKYSCIFRIKNNKLVSTCGDCREEGG